MDAFTAADFLALNPTPGVKYTLLGALGRRLVERELDSSGTYLIATSEGEVYRSDAVVDDNTYTGFRYPLKRMD